MTASDLSLYISSGTVTEIFSLKPSIHSNIIAKKLINRYCWVLIIPCLFFLLLGYFYSTTWYYLVPISIFLLAPVIFFFAWFVSTLNYEAAAALRPHRLEFTETDIICRLYDYEPIDSDFRSKEKDNKKFKKYLADEFILKERSHRNIPLSEISDIETDRGWIIINLNQGLGNFIIIPGECQKIGNNKV